MPEAAERDLAGHGDGSRVDQLLHAGADEGDPEQMAVVFIDDHARPACVAVGVQVCADHLLAGVDIDDADAVPRTFGLVGGQADQAGRGSQKNICGTAW
jgi:hypothetical protein